MPINVSFSLHIENVLTHSGFQKKQWRKGVLGTRIYIRGEQAVVVIPTIEISPSHVAPIQQSIDDYLTRLQNVLVGLAKKHDVTDIFLPGCGHIPLPPWFPDWCAQNGIHVHVLGPEEPGNIDFQNQEMAKRMI